MSTELRPPQRPRLGAPTPEAVPLAFGDRLLPEAPVLDVRRPTAKAVAGQVGHGVEVLGSVPVSASHGLLVAAHHHDSADLPPLGGVDERERTKISMAAHGLSVAAVRRHRRAGDWSVLDPVRTRFHRRVHGSTIVKLTGPAAGDVRLRTEADPAGRHVRGTFGHSVGTITPWGAVLSGEGRFADHFEASGEVEPALRSSFRRYALAQSAASGRGWAAVDPRFDLTRTPQEAFRFGWVVLLDPRRPSSRPRKLTMLGRLGHARLDASIADDGRATIRLADAVDDASGGRWGGFEYAYVSRDTVDHGVGPLAGRANRRLLTTGTLFLVPPGSTRPDDPAGWLPLTTDTTSYVPGMSVASVLLDTRLAAHRLLGGG
jgi:secreted PhoX family phosphatase